MSDISLKKTGTASLPLHYGKAPPWLFKRMVKLAREITLVIVGEFGAEEMLRRLSHPYWFQALGCVLGFDWHSSGVTTTVCGALKEAVKDIQPELNLYICGGKGKTSRRTPEELLEWGQKLSLNTEPLIYASKMSAKVDSAAIQDGYQLYHHVFLFTKEGDWAVIQQGMHDSNHYARRYHWLGEKVQDFVNEPHAGVAAEARTEGLNLVASESDPARKTIASIIKEEKPEQVMRELHQLTTLSMPARHDMRPCDLHPESLKKILVSSYEQQPSNFERLLALPGVGAKTIRALSLISELIYGVAPSYRDPARYSFAHGGKDGIPYPVDRKTYDQSIQLLGKALGKAHIEQTEKHAAFSRLDKVRI